MEKFYDQDGIVVRKAKISDIDALKNIRESDVEEIWASHNYVPKEALEIGIRKSLWAATIEKEKPLGCFGIYTDNILGDQATVWFLATDDLKYIKRRFLRHSRKFVDIMLEFYPKLFNYADARNRESIEWLRWMGAKIEEAKPYGKEKMPFHYFSFERSK